MNANDTDPWDEPTEASDTAPGRQPTTGPPPPGGGPPGPGGPGGPGEEPPPDDEARRIALIVTAVLAGLVLIVGLIVFLVSGDGDEVADTTSTSSSTSTSSTSTSTSIPDTTTSTSSTSTTTSTTTTSTSTSTSTTTTSTTTTTVPLTTAPAPTTALAPTTTVTLPVVTVPPTPAPTILDVIVNSPDLSAFREAAELAGIEDLLDGPAAVTVFVPSNPAFEQFAAGIGNEDLTPEELSEILRHHVVEGALLADAVLATDAITPVFGPDLVIDRDAVTVDGATLLVVDVETGGSVLHVVDRVLAPT